MAVEQTTHNFTDVTFDSPKGKAYEQRVGPGPYIGKLERLERAPDGQYGANIYWYWGLYNTAPDENGKSKVIPAQLNEDGSVYEWREKTSTKFGRNPKSGVSAKARERAEALLKREIQDDDDPASIAREIIGNGAMLYLTTQQGSDGNMYLNMKAIEPYRPGMQAPVQRIDETPGEPEAEEEAALPFG